MKADSARILVIEDEAPMRAVLKDILTGDANNMSLNRGGAI
jgi:chemotaxis response regulator CheB